VPDTPLKNGFLFTLQVSSGAVSPEGRGERATSVGRVLATEPCCPAARRCPSASLRGERGGGARLWDAVARCREARAAGWEGLSVLLFCIANKVKLTL